MNKEQLVTRLASLNVSQQSIEGTSKWCVFYMKVGLYVHFVLWLRFRYACPWAKVDVCRVREARSCAALRNPWLSHCPLLAWGVKECLHRRIHPKLSLQTCMTI